MDEDVLDVVGEIIESLRGDVWMVELSTELNLAQTTHGGRSCTAHHGPAEDLGQRARHGEFEMGNLIDEESMHFFHVMLEDDRMGFVLDLQLTFFDLEDERPTAEEEDDVELVRSSSIPYRQRAS